MPLSQKILDQAHYDASVPQTPPTTNNYLTSNRFKFSIQRCPNIAHFCQRINVPSIGFGNSIQANPTGIEIRRPGTRYAFEDISLGFLVDENMKNWLEIFEWLKSIGIYTGCKETIKEDDKVSTAYLLITNSAYVPIINVTYHNIFPVMLTSIDFDSTLGDAEPVIATATFAFTHYDIELI